MDFQSTWLVIKEKGLDVLVQYLEGKRQTCLTPVQYMEVYTLTYNICCTTQHSNADKLFDKANEYLNDYLFKLHSKLIHSKEKLVLYIREYKKFQIFTKWFQKVFVYLERYHLQEKGYKKLIDICGSRFEYLIIMEHRDLLFTECYNNLSLDALVVCEFLKTINNTTRNDFILYVEKQLPIPEPVSLLDIWYHHEFFLKMLNNVFNETEVSKFRHIILDKIFNKYEIQKAEFENTFFTQSYILKDLFRDRKITMLEKLYFQFLRDAISIDIPDLIRLIKLNIQTLNNPILKELTEQLKLALHTVSEQYADDLLKYMDKNIKTLEDIDECLFLVHCISSKDIFINKYCALLSKRLFKGSNIDNENYIVKCFKKEYGSTYTSRMEGMLRDMIIEPLVVENMSVQVITHGFWSNIIPFEIKTSLLDRFIAKFIDKHNFENKKLSWKLWLGTLTINAQYGDKSYQFQLSTAQGLVLLELNRREKITVDDFSKEFNVDCYYLKPLIHSLCANKYEVISKSGEKDKMANEDTIWINKDFNVSNKIAKFVLPSISVKKVLETHEISRDLIIDSAIVRIMKSRKVIGHNTLLPLVVSEIKMFKPTVQHIKKRIEALIEKEYLERCGDQYTYIS